MSLREELAASLFSEAVASDLRDLREQLAADRECWDAAGPPNSASPALKEEPACRGGLDVQDVGAEVRQAIRELEATTMDLESRIQELSRRVAEQAAASGPVDLDGWCRELSWKVKEDVSQGLAADFAELRRTAESDQVQQARLVAEGAAARVEELAGTLAEASAALAERLVTDLVELREQFVVGRMAQSDEVFRTRLVAESAARRAEELTGRLAEVSVELGTRLRELSMQVAPAAVVTDDGVRGVHGLCLDNGHQVELTNFCWSADVDSAKATDNGVAELVEQFRASQQNVNAKREGGTQNPALFAQQYTALREKVCTDQDARGEEVLAVEQRAASYRCPVDAAAREADVQQIRSQVGRVRDLLEALRADHEELLANQKNLETQFGELRRNAGLVDMRQLPSAARTNDTLEGTRGSAIDTADAEALRALEATLRNLTNSITAENDSQRESIGLLRLECEATCSHVNRLESDLREIFQVLHDDRELSGQGLSQKIATVQDTKADVAMTTAEEASLLVQQNASHVELMCDGYDVLAKRLDSDLACLGARLDGFDICKFDIEKSLANSRHLEATMQCLAESSEAESTERNDALLRLRAVTDAASTNIGIVEEDLESLRAAHSATQHIVEAGFKDLQGILQPLEATVEQLKETFAMEIVEQRAALTKMRAEAEESRNSIEGVDRKFEQLRVLFNSPGL